ncbi:MAG TPA: hypothetical protein ENL22_04245 [candidate division Zixibacteria bacterium]|nr:hypothetical protein [candidate division Zixibacteria bacterium]
MLKNLAIMILIFLIPLSSLYGKSSENYLKFYIGSADELQSLTNIISVADVKGLTVYAFANDYQLLRLEKSGYEYELLPSPGDRAVLRMSDTPDDIRAWDSYPTYTAYVDMMNQFAADYPSLCVVENIGTTVNGRALLYAKISDNVSVEEDEPEVMYTSTMHGNETVGYILSLRLIDYLLSNYGTDSLVTRLVDSCEIWINPIANPDGTYYYGDHTVSGARRFNANGVDLNRNFPDPQDGDHPDGHSWQPETMAMMNFAEAHSFVISANIHAGVEVVNYPWDTWVTRHADDAWYIDISRQYADSAQFFSPAGYMDYLNNGITNGFDWYMVNGGRQDYMNYWHHCREITLELSNDYLLDEEYLDDHWTYNKSSLLNYLESGLYGIRGLVTDAVTSLPVDALVRVIGHDLDSSQVRTDPDVGDYHRMIEAGTYDLEFTADNYYTDTVASIVVTDNNTVLVDMALIPITGGVSIVFSGHTAENPEPDDIVDIDITLTNYGLADATNLVGALSCTDSYISITQASSLYPTISGQMGEGTSLSSYQFAVASDCPVNHSVEFRLDLTADEEYSDNIFFNMTINPVVDNFETGDFSYLPWQHLGDQQWTVVPSSRYEGSYMAGSGAVNDNQNSSLQIEISIVNDDIISFYYRVSSETGGDYLSFYIDDEIVGAYSGEIDWTRAVFEVTAGLHTFLWVYEKDGSSYSGDDAAWLDYIIFPELTGDPAISTEFLPNWEVGNPYSQQLEANGAIGVLSWVDKYNDLTGTGLTLSSDGMVSGTPMDEGTISFTAMVTDEINGTDEKLFSFEINQDWICGDVNRDGDINILDIVYLINFKYKSGSAPDPPESADVNNDLTINILDIVYLINFKYKTGPEPDCP